MGPNNVLPPCSGAEMVSQKSSSRTRLDATRTSQLLSAVTPADSNIMGLGISFDLEQSPKISTTSSTDGSVRISKNKFHATEASNTLVSVSKKSASAVASHQNNRSDALIARTGPLRWPSGVPGLGNTILGPRCPCISNVSCPPAINRHYSPILSPHTTSPTAVHLAAPQSIKSSRAIRTSTKRRANSPPSTGLSAKLAKVSVDSPFNSIYAQPPIVKHDQKEEQCMVYKIFGTRHPGLSETEKRAKAAKLWKVEQEKINQQLEKEIASRGVKTLSDENGFYVGEECSVQEGPQLLNSDTDLESCARVNPLSPEIRVGIEYVCDTIDDAPRRSIEQGDEHGGHYKPHKNPKLLRQDDESGKKIAKLDEAASYKQPTQTIPRNTTNTLSKSRALPSAIKKFTPTTTFSNDKKRVSFADQTNLSHLTSQFLALLEPYTRLHASCSAVRPLQLIHSALSSTSPTVKTLNTALKDSQELLKVLAADQIATLDKLEAMSEEMGRVGMGSVMEEARERVKRTEEDVKKLGDWMGECGRFD